ncbi:MAG: acetyl-CoA carboxylase biotin carboxyl carrier protein [Clostridiales bacterium]|nr:acetyl-CoA carboxylase biotin carboxyl carrier protein [Clostridiales bacterium]
MGKIDNSVKTISELIELMNDNGVGKLEVKDGDFSVKLESLNSCISNAPASTVSVTQAAVSTSDSCESAAISGNVITSPIVGTFYAAPAPDQSPFVEKGASVEKGDVVFIIESMKLMNEIQSEFSGKVAEIFVENGEAVEFGTPIMRIE